MILTQDEVNALTHKRYGTRESLVAWFAQVDELTSAPTYPVYVRETNR